jgi:hypothetical protein
MVVGFSASLAVGLDIDAGPGRPESRRRARREVLAL